MHTMLAGKCVGGPLDGKMLYHGEPIYQIGKDRLSKNRLIIGYQGLPTRDIMVGSYRYSDGAWHWRSPKDA